MNFMIKELSPSPIKDEELTHLPSMALNLKLDQKKHIAFLSYYKDEKDDTADIHDDDEHDDDDGVSELTKKIPRMKKTTT